jgi:hypothetical protein
VKNSLVITGFPRSGNNYLNYSFKSLYYLNDEPNQYFHLTSVINSLDHVFVPFRNPKDSISSWNYFQLKTNIDADIRFYIRFHTEVLNNLKKITLMDFDKFTTNLEYTKQKVKSSIGLETSEMPSTESIKLSMTKDGKAKNLPSNNKEELEEIGLNLSSRPSFKECLDLYNSLKAIQDIA